MKIITTKDGKITAVNPLTEEMEEGIKNSLPCRGSRYNPKMVKIEVCKHHDKCNRHKRYLAISKHSKYGFPANRNELYFDYMRNFRNCSLHTEGSEG